MTPEQIRAERRAGAEAVVGTGEVCPSCRGKGAHLEVYVWSDGPGMVEVVCPYCKGTGAVGGAAHQRERVVDAERKLAETRAALDKLRTYAGLYIDVIEDRLPKAEPDPDRPGYIKPYPGSGYALAHRPPSRPDYYLDKFREAGRKASRA